MIRCVLMVVFVLMLMPVSGALAQGFSSGCAFRPLPLVRVDVRENPVNINHQQTRSQLTAQPNNTHLRIPGAEAVAGLTANPIQATASLSFDSESSFLGGSGCLWLTTLTIQITAAPEISIAKELAENSCQYRAVLAHEQKHVAVDRELLQAFAKRIEPTFRDFAREMAVQGPLPSSVMYQAQNTTTNRINIRLQSEMTKFQHERDRKQQALDTAAEYHAIASQCR